MADVLRRPEQNSPKSSPLGSRSPATPRQDTTGTLKTTITLGRNPSIIQGGPFYLMKDPPEDCELTGSTNLMAYHGLEHAYNRFSGKKLKEELSAFLPSLPGNIDTPGLQDNSSLRSLIEKPPIVGKEIAPLSGAALTGFRLHPGPLPEQYRLMTQVAPKRKKHKKHKKEGAKDGPVTSQDSPPEARIKTEPTTEGAADAHKKTKKAKKSDEEKEKKKRKKEKKKKKEKEKEEKSDKQPTPP